MAMRTVRTVSALRETLRCWRSEGARIAFVPTMGNLHAGHIALVEAAKASADKVVVSIFVNPTQFGQGEDYETYPRTEAEDSSKLEVAGVDLLFLPAVTEMYSADAKTVVTVKALSGLHCGVFRPGHFDGVATVVCKLFNMVQPDAAYFGRKDFQQLTLIQTMVRDLDMPVEIKSIDTVRESSGLALSSRNGYLSAKELHLAPLLYRSMLQAREQLLGGQLSPEAIAQNAIEQLQESGFKVDYFSICRVSDLLPASHTDTELVILAAAKLGKTRLIDNISVKRPFTP